MVTKTCVAVMCLALAIMLASCGGGGASQQLLAPANQSGNNRSVIPGGNNSPGGQDVPIIEGDIGMLPGTIPEMPKDLSSAIEQSALGAEKTVCAGNGRNDRLMLKEAGLGVAFLLSEGTCVETLLASDLVVKDAMDFFMLFKEPNRLIASLRC